MVRPMGMHERGAGADWAERYGEGQVEQLASGIRSKREAAENKRVFYVAATRAREELHLFGAAKLSARESSRCRATTACCAHAGRRRQSILNRC